MGLLFYGFKVVWFGVRYGLLGKALICSNHQLIFQLFSLSAYLISLLNFELILQVTQRWSDLYQREVSCQFWKMELGALHLQTAGFWQWLWKFRPWTAGFATYFHFSNLFWCTQNFWIKCIWIMYWLFVTCVQF